MEINIGKKINRLRKEKGLSQSQLAQKAGLTQRQIGYYEQEAPEGLLKNLSAIADALGVSLVELLSDEKPSELQKIFENVDARTIRKIKLILTLPKKELHIVYAIVDGLIAKIEKENK